MQKFLQVQPGVAGTAWGQPKGHLCALDASSSRARRRPNKRAGRGRWTGRELGAAGIIFGDERAPGRNGVIERKGPG